MVQATQTSLGEVKLAGDIAGSTNALAPELTLTGVIPGVYTNPSLTIDAKGRVTNAASTSAEALLNFLPSATATSRGVVQLGQNIVPNAINPDIIEVPFATTTVAGVAKIGSGLTMVDNALSHEPVVATSSEVGFVKIGAGLAVDGTGTVSLSIPTATTTVKGAVSVPAGNGLAITDGVLSAVDASTSVRGVIRAGTGFTIDASGTLSAALPDATTSSKGVVQISAGGGLSIASGVLSATAPIATTASKGLVQIGSGLAIDAAGVVSLLLPDATTSTKGIVQIGSGLAVNTGVVSLNMPVATTTTAGAFRPGVGLTVTSDVVAVDSSVVLTFPQGGVFQSAIVSKLADLPASATVTPDFAVSNMFRLVATSNFTLANPVNMVSGGVYYIGITQDATGGRTITWDSNYRSQNKTSPEVLGTAAGTIDMYRLVAYGNLILVTPVGRFNP